MALWLLYLQILMCLISLPKSEGNQRIPSIWPERKPSTTHRSYLEAALTLIDLKHTIYVGTDVEELISPDSCHVRETQEIYNDPSAAIMTLHKTSKRPSSIIVIYGKPLWIVDYIGEAIAKGVVVFKHMWVLMPTEPVDSKFFLTSEILTNQHNFILLQMRNGRKALVQAGMCQIVVYKIAYSQNGVKWDRKGCVKTSESGLGTKIGLGKGVLRPPLTFNGRVVSVGIVERSPEFRLAKGPRGGLRLVGLPIDIIELLKKSWNFTYKVTRIKGFGSQASNGSWSGLVGAVAQKKIDVGLASLSLTYERYLVADYSEGLLEGNTHMMFIAKEIEKPIFIVFLVFSPTVWLSLLLVVLLLATGIFITFKNTDTNTELSPVDAISTALRLVTNQGVLSPRRTTSRLAYLSGLMLGLIIYATYSGNLTAFLSIPRLQKYPRSAQEMLDQGYSPILTMGFSHHDFFKYSPVETYQKLYQRALERGTVHPFGFANQKIGRERLRAKAATIISSFGVEISQNNGAKPNEPCPFFVEPTPLVSSFSHFIMQKNSYLKFFFDNKIIKLRDMGMLDKVSRDHRTIHCISGKIVEDETRKLSLTDLQGAFLLWITGIILAVMLFTAEYAYGKWSPKGRAMRK